MASHNSCLDWDGVASGLVYFPETGATDEPIVSHHVRMGGHGGVGLKPSDYRSVPLRDSEHRELHQKGEKAFWTARGVNPGLIIIALLVSHTQAPDEVLAKFSGDTRATIAVLESIAEGQ